MPHSFKKKSFKTCKKYLFTSIKSSLMYINYGKMGALTIFDTGKAGLNCSGSKHLQEVFQKHKAEFEAAAKLDKKSLKDETLEVAPPPPKTQMSAFLKLNTEVKKLEQHLPIMETQELMDYLYPLIHMEVQERGILNTRIYWRDESYRPSFWPEDIAPWRHFCNPNQPQKYKFPFTMVQILKIAVYRCLMARGIDPREHVTEDLDQKLVRNKLRYRGMKTLDEAYERFYSMFLLKTEPQDVKQVPEDEASQRMSYSGLKNLGEKMQFRNEDDETFEYSDEDNMSADEDISGLGGDRAAAISNILSILAGD